MTNLTFAQGQCPPFPRTFPDSARYTLHAETRTFFQMHPSDEQTLPVDVMMVNEPTFAKMLALAKECSALPPAARVVSLEHLLALKCHAIKHGHPGRVEKDVDDELGLVRANQLDVTASDWREIFLKYGPPENMKSCEKPGKNRLLDLELPDWSQMHNSAQKVSPVAALKRVEEYYRLFPRAAKASRAQRVIARLPEFEL